MAAVEVGARFCEMRGSPCPAPPRVSIKVQGFDPAYKEKSPRGMSSTLPRILPVGLVLLWPTFSRREAPFSALEAALDVIFLLRAFCQRSEEQK